MKKIIALSALCGLIPAVNIVSMGAGRQSTERDMTTKLADFFNFSLMGNVSSILDEIKRLESGKAEINELQQQKKMAMLYQELASNPQAKSLTRTKFENKAKQHFQCVSAIEEEMNAMEENILAGLNDKALPKLPKLERLKRTIAGYEQLVELSKGSYIKNGHYVNALRTYEKQKLRKEIRYQIAQAQSANNKPGLCIAYQSLMKTYLNSSDPEVAAIQAQLAQTQKAIAQEKRDEEIKDITDLLIKSGSPEQSYSSPAQRLITMANFVIARADIYKEDEERYKEEYEDDMRRAGKLALQAAGHKEYKECKNLLDPRLR